MSDTRTKRRVFRPSGLSVFAGVVVLVGALWWLFADRVVERSVESTGASLTGARVDLVAADVSPTEGRVSLTGLEVANPDRPMKNLFEAESIVADLRIEPLLERKVVLEQVEIRGMRFDTDRTESGLLDDPDPEAGALWREIDAWADGIRIPELSLDNLSGAVRTEAISEDSLATVRFAREALGRADSMSTDWEAQLERIDPRPRIDSVRAVVERLEEFRLTPLNALQLPGLVRDGRAALASLADVQTEVAELDDAVRAGIGSLALSSERMEELRAADMAYARSLLDIPSLEAPSISPALFGSTALAWMRPVLYWTRTAERFLPPGLDPRRRPGPKRARAEGTTYDFRRGAEWPSFLLERGEVSLEIDGTGAAAGAYEATLGDLTTSPTLWGRPMTIDLGRRDGTSAIDLGMMLDHREDVIRDSLELRIQGLELPDVSLSVFGGSLRLGVGEHRLDASRVGDRIDVRLGWVTDDITWDAGGTTEVVSAEIGSLAWGRDLVRRAVAGLEGVELTVGLQGELTSPTLVVESNVGAAVAESLRREVGREVAAAEERIRAEVSAQAEPHVQRARARVDEVRARVVDRVGERRAEVELLRERLQQRIDELGRGRETERSSSVGVGQSRPQESL